MNDIVDVEFEEAEEAITEIVKCCEWIVYTRDDIMIAVVNYPVAVDKHRVLRRFSFIDGCYAVPCLGDRVG